MVKPYFFPRIFFFSKKKDNCGIFNCFNFQLKMLSKLWPVLPIENCPLERFQFLISLTKQANKYHFLFPVSPPTHRKPWAALRRFPRPGAGPGICFCQSDMKIWHIRVKKHGVQDSWFPLLSCHGEIQISDELIPWSPDTSTNFINSFYFFSPFILSPAEVCLQGV